jgi:hypothetical protein
VTEVTDVDRAGVATSGSRQDPLVARMLERADAAAARGDYDDALSCLRHLVARGHPLDHAYETRCAAWRLKAENVRVGCSQWFG